MGTIYTAAKTIGLILLVQYAMQILPVDVNKLLPYVDKVEFEIAVLKGWRKANGKIAKRIRKQEASKQKAEGK